MGWTVKESGFDSRQRQRDVLISIRSRPSLGPTQPPRQWVQGAVSLGVKRQGCESDHSPSCSVEVNNCGATAHPYVFVACYLNNKYIYLPLWPDLNWGSPRLLSYGYQGLFARGYRDQCVKLTTHLHLMRRLRIYAAISPSH
jgi:hypothetical protein